MKKYAFFVEGLTEQLFVEKLLIEVFGKNNIRIDIKKIQGGSSIPISITTIVSSGNTTTTGHYVLIYNCGGDSSIRSYIQDQRQGLLQQGYLKVFGLRDVYPAFSRHEISKLQRGLNYGLPQKGLPIKFILAIMEIEAWFLAEENHYMHIDSRLTVDFIRTNFSFDPSSYDTGQRDEPAQDLHNIYQLAGKEYIKKANIIERTINSLDYGNIYLKVSSRISALGELINEINSFF